MKSEAITGTGNESNIPGEGKMTFDIVYKAKTSYNDVKIIYVNIEAQKDFYPGYDLVTRGIIYSARLLSQQMDVEYTARNYDGVKKVYSIWICMNCPEKSKLENIYKLPMTREMEEEAAQMCNLSEVIEERGIEKGQLTERLSSIKNLMHNAKITFDEACDLLGIEDKEYFRGMVE